MTTSQGTLSPLLPDPKSHARFPAQCQGHEDVSGAWRGNRRGCPCGASRAGDGAPDGSERVPATALPFRGFKTGRPPLCLPAALRKHPQRHTQTSAGCPGRGAACGARRFCPFCPLRPGLQAATLQDTRAPPRAGSPFTGRGLRGPPWPSGRSRAKSSKLALKPPGAATPRRGPPPSRLPPAAGASVSPSAPKPALACTPRPPPTTSPGPEHSRGPRGVPSRRRPCSSSGRDSHQPGSSRSSIRPSQPGFPKTSSPSDFLPNS